MQKVVDVKPIWAGFVTILKEEDLDNIVELPLLNACKDLFCKNIRTIMSSCNMFNVKGLNSYMQTAHLNQNIKEIYSIGEKHAWLMLDYDSLSEENKKIMAEYYNGDKENFIYSVEQQELYNNAPIDFKEKCTGIMNMPHYNKRAIIMRYPLTMDTTIKEVNDYFLSICQSLKPEQEKLTQENTPRYKLLQLAKKYQKPLEQMEISVDDTMFKEPNLITHKTSLKELYGLKDEMAILWTLFLIATLDLFDLLEENSFLLILSIEKSDIHFLYNGKEYHLACFKEYPKEQLLQFGDIKRGINKLKQEKELIDLFRQIDDYNMLANEQYRINNVIKKNI